MPVIIGKQAACVKIYIFINRDSKLDVIDGVGNKSSVRISLEYTHLGNHKDANISRAKEISFRIAGAASAIKERCRSTRTAHVDPPKHWNWAVSLCVFRLAYDAHTCAFFSFKF